MWRNHRSVGLPHPCGSVASSPPRHFLLRLHGVLLRFLECCFRCRFGSVPADRFGFGRSADRYAINPFLYLLSINRKKLDPKIGVGGRASRAMPALRSAACPARFFFNKTKTPKTPKTPPPGFHSRRSRGKTFLCPAGNKNTFPPG
jgi:hypothetical protein